MRAHDENDEKESGSLPMQLCDWACSLDGLIVIGFTVFMFIVLALLFFNDSILH